MSSDGVVSAWDDFPVHQAAEWIRHVAPSDKNFYDRYYFNLHGSDDTLLAIFGMGQYPNLGVQDAFVVVRIGDEHHVVRSSRPITDRSDLSVGPFRIEVLEPLKRLRVVLEDTEHSLSMDVIWEGSGAVIPEPGQYLRSKGKIVFDTQRLAQLGSWEGSLTVGERTFEVTPDRWMGSRDRSWGVRPVGEPDQDGIRKGANVMAGMWNYFPIRFDDHNIYLINHEQPDGARMLVQAERQWHDPSRSIEELGHFEHEHHFVAGTRELTHSTITFPESGMTLECRSLLCNYLGVGTGYGLDADWRHGMWQGEELVVQGFVKPVAEVAPLGRYAVLDHVGRFEYDGNVGYGLYEQGFFGPFPRYGMTDGVMGAP